MLQNEIWNNPKAPGIKLNPTRLKFQPNKNWGDMPKSIFGNNSGILCFGRTNP